MMGHSFMQSRSFVDASARGVPALGFSNKGTRFCRWEVGSRPYRGSEYLHQSDDESFVGLRHSS